MILLSAIRIEDLERLLSIIVHFKQCFILQKGIFDKICTFLSPTRCLVKPYIMVAWFNSFNQICKGMVL